MLVACMGGGEEHTEGERLHGRLGLRLEDNTKINNQGAGWKACSE
jgi:hypothetical protein